MTEKQKNDTLKNEEQPRSFIQRSWIILLALLVAIGLVLTRSINPVQQFDWLLTLNAVWWWQAIRNAFMLAAIFLPIFLVIYIAIRSYWTRRRPRARFYGIITGLVVIFAFLVVVRAPETPTTYHRFPPVDMGEGRLYTVVTWAQILGPNGFGIYEHNAQNDSFHMILHDSLGYTQRLCGDWDCVDGFPYTGEAANMPVEVRKNGGNLEIWREDKLITSISLADGE